VLIKCGLVVECPKEGGFSGGFLLINVEKQYYPRNMEASYFIAE
jgi:hypothetical protein